MNITPISAVSFERRHIIKSNNSSKASRIEQAFDAATGDFFRWIISQRDSHPASEITYPLKTSPLRFRRKEDITIIS